MPSPERRATLDDVERFTERHIGPRPADVERMLEVVGYPSLDALVDAAVPKDIRLDRGMALPDAGTETDVLAELRGLAGRNQPLVSMIGLGYSDTVTPAVIRRVCLESPSWYTAYTPYQPEISQGRLEALLNFQTLVADLTGLPIANASLLDEATAAAEALAIASRTHPGAWVVDTRCWPQTVAVVRTRAEPLGIPVHVVDVVGGELPEGDLAGVLVQDPADGGAVRDLSGLVGRVHERGALAIVATDLLACTLVVPPGEQGADIAVGSAQRFGVPLGFGGPHAGFIAVREGLARTLPGRLVGVSVDADGHPAYRLALQTREQHIRREKATSNICTAQVLLAVVAAMYASYHGPEGLRRIAGRVHRHAVVLREGLRLGGVAVADGPIFDTVTATGVEADVVVAAARDRGINLRRVDAGTVVIACDEVTRPAHLEAVWEAFGVETEDAAGLDATTPDDHGPGRTSAYLQHPVFHEHRSETAMLRYLRELADHDIALDRSSIPLGSCTMKLNAATEMEPISMPGFAALHPFAPADQAQGYLRLIADLESWLAEITGYDAVSLQPNAGSQGELAGLLAVRGYHAARGDTGRDVCVIPSSAHGTNAASAAMAGMRVAVVKVREDGDVDLDDLRAVLAKHEGRVAVAMVTYPSTHGIFETGIRELCDLVHAAGGQVYVDGANLNALVGLARPGDFGGDVSHLNLHKTFCIPHGGGGPGIGPVAVKAHLAAYLPGHPLVAELGDGGAVSAAPYGSAGVLPISWAYVRLMGPDGLTSATQHAILAANYVATRLAPHFPVLFTGEQGLVAHECIIDLRPVAKQTGIDAEDVAKRLADHGIHGPTMSFPVAGTLMIEPTESEDAAELDRFIDAMLSVKAEIDRVASGEWPRDDNPLVMAPHPARMVTGDDWPHPYTREQAAYPTPATRARKLYWPPVRRIEGAYGDRNLLCTCPPPEAFED